MKPSSLTNKDLTKQNFRPEIQGIRLLGALLVASFHIWGNSVSGGVDVFFVISGYFLGFGWLNQEFLGKKFSAKNHINRFINRTIPEVSIVLLFCILITVFLLSPSSWANNLAHIFFSAIYLENFWLIHTSTDYLARNENISIVQHFWAISIIAQVYVSWICIVWLANLGKKYSNKAAIFWITSILALLGVLSLIYGIWFTGYKPDSAYFDPASRYWQFSAGALTALLSYKFNKSNSIFVFIGLALIISCGFIIGSNYRFPGVAAIWPVTGAILILLFSKDNRSFLTKIFSLPIIVKAGNLGFGIYLWHWPIYILYLRLINTNPDIFSGIMIILISTILALLSSKVASKQKNISVKKSLILLLFLAIIASTSFGLRKIVVSSPDVANIFLSKIYSSSIIPGPLDVYSSLPESYSIGCHVSGDDPKPQTCIFNKEGKNGTIYLVGGSHAAHWLPALQTLITDLDLKIYTSTKSSCTFANPKDSFINEIGFNESCKKWNETIIKEIIETAPDLVVAIGTRTLVKGEKVEEIIPNAYISNFKILKENNIQVLAIRDTPNMGIHIPACIHKFNYQESDCQQQRNKHLDDLAFMKYKNQVSDWLYIADPMKYFCSTTTCNSVKDNIMIYRDAHHLTVEYSKLLGPWMREQLEIVNKSPI